MPNEDRKDFSFQLRRALDRSLNSGDAVPGDKPGQGEYSRSRFSFLKKTDPRRIEAFTRELSILLSSGIDLLSSIKLLAGRAGDPDFKKVLATIARRVERGSSFWGALSGFGRYFPKIYISSIKAGESSGKLEFALDELSRFYEFEIQTRKKIKTVAAYPVLVLILSAAVVIILSLTVLPVFSDMIAELGAETPAVVGFLAVVGGFVRSYWFVIVILVLFFIFLPSILKLFPAGAVLCDRFKLKTPVFGRIFLSISISRFSRNLAIMLASGVRITEAFDACAEGSGNSVIRGKLYGISESIEKGGSIESILSDPGIFPPLLVDMLVVGEKSGELEKVLNRVADVYGREAEDSISTFAAVLEPALILCMGILVAFVFASLFLPYISIISAMGSGV